MTKSQFQKRINSVKKDISAYISKETDRLFASGGIDPTEFADDFRLPRIILTVTLCNLADQYRPLSDDLREHIKNLKHF